MFNENYYSYDYPRRNNFLPNIKKIKWSSFLDGTQKTLSIINQAIPIIYQIKPIYQNAKTAFKVVNIFKEETKNKKERVKTNITNSNNSPIFFL